MHRTPRAGRRAAGAAAAAGVIAAAGLLAGCSSSSDTDNHPAAVDVASAARSAVRDGGTLRWAVDDVPGTFNAYQDGADAQTSLVADATLPTLFTVDGYGRPQRDGDYLSSAAVTKTSPQVVDYRINPKAVWSNGRPITAADFVSQFKALGGADTDYFTAHNTGYDRIASVRRGKDSREVKVTFKKPLAAWRSLFTPLYPKEVTGDPGTFNDGLRDALPVTSGPFRLSAVDGRAGTMTLTRDRRWWGDRAKLSRLVFTAVPDDRRAAALAHHTVDVAGIDTSALAAAKRVSGVTVRKAPGPEYTQLTLNGGGPGPLADERVRKAVARAIDRQDLADFVLRPAGLPARTLGNHLVMGTQFGYQDDSSAIGKPDVKSARSLLTDAGWLQNAAPSSAPAKAAADPAAHRAHPASPATAASGSASASAPASASASLSPSASGSASARPADDTSTQTVVQPASVRANKAGVPLTLRFMLPAGSPTLDAVGNRIAHMLAAIGVRTELDRVGDQSFFTDHVDTGDFDLALFDWPASAFPVDDARPVYLKPMPAADGSLDVRQNYARVGTDQIDQLLDRATRELDPGKARGLARKADAHLWAVAGSLPLYQPPQLVAERSDAANVGAFGFQTPRFQDIGFHR